MARMRRVLVGVLAACVVSLSPGVASAATFTLGPNGEIAHIPFEVPTFSLRGTGALPLGPDLSLVQTQVDLDMGGGTGHIDIFPGFGPGTPGESVEVLRGNALLMLMQIRALPQLTLTDVDPLNDFLFLSPSVNRLDPVEFHAFREFAAAPFSANLGARVRHFAFEETIDRGHNISANFAIVIEGLDFADVSGTETIGGVIEGNNQVAATLRGRVNPPFTLGMTGPMTTRTTVEIPATVPAPAVVPLLAVGAGVLLATRNGRRSMRLLGRAVLDRLILSQR